MVHIAVCRVRAHVAPRVSPKDTLCAVACAACHPTSTGASTLTALVDTLAMGDRATAMPLRGTAGTRPCPHKREAGRYRGTPSAVVHGRRIGRETAWTPRPLRGAVGGSPFPEGEDGPFGTDACRRRRRGRWLDSLLAWPAPARTYAPTAASIMCFFYRRCGCGGSSASPPRTPPA